jgi:Protein of unknown function (DUF2561)
MLLGQKRRDTTVPTRRKRRAKRPANVIAAIVGVCAIALGVWALVKTGINTDHIFTPTKDVLGLPHTPTLALGEIAFGVVLLVAAALGKFGTFLIALAGAASFAFGVIVLSDSWSGRVHRWTAADHDSGWVFIGVGAVLVLAAVLPSLVSKRRVQPHEAPAMEREPVPAEPGPATASDSPDESAQPAHTGAVRPTATTTDVRDADNVNTHATG